MEEDLSKRGQSLFLNDVQILDIVLSIHENSHVLKVSSAENK